MCDIMVATPKVTKDGKMLFAKNSDRDPNEAQIIEYIPRRKHEETEVKLTYVKFPQVSETYALVISRPWWIWGAEMGVNEFGLAIGNTAVFTKERREKVGILGMDMIRLALERMRGAKEALNFIVDIIENYGQGGSGSYEHKFLYHNSFIIADPKESYVLETAGKHWVAKKIDRFYSISNALTIKDDWDMASDSILAMARKSNFDFSKKFSDKFYTHFAHGHERRDFTYSMLQKKEGEIDIEYMMHILRAHNSNYNPLYGSMKDVCMHYGGYLRPSQTASSQISVLGEDIHLFTGESNPCLAIFKPFFFKSPWWIKEENVNNRYNEGVFWWRCELFHRRFHINYTKYFEKFKEERDSIQREVMDLLNHGDEATRRAFEMEENLIARWMKILGQPRVSFKYKRIWEKVNRRANIPLR